MPARAARVRTTDFGMLRVRRVQLGRGETVKPEMYGALDHRASLQQLGGCTSEETVEKKIGRLLALVAETRAAVERGALSAREQQIVDVKVRWLVEDTLKLASEVCNRASKEGP